MASFNDNIVTVSAPGKALIAGGYLVLESPNVGIVIGASSRFYTTIQLTSLDNNLQLSSSSSSSCTVLNILVDSPQFHTKFMYKYNIDSNTLELISENSNEFVEKCLSLVLSFCREFLKYDKFKQDIIDNYNNKQLCIKLCADNDFYSQIKELQKKKLPLLSSSLMTIRRFNPCPINSDTGKMEVAKTGMGSSAALTTSLVGALLQWFNVVHLEDDSLKIESKRIIHNVSQLAHAIAQGKLGSGFDVAAAVYGTQMYIRFLAEGFSSCMEPNASSHTIYDAVMDKSKWGQTVKQFSLPPNMDIIMGDVCGGSSSTSMARAVLQWRVDKPEIANEVWTTLANTNLELYQSFELLNELIKINEVKFQLSLKKLSELTYDEWLLENDDDLAKALIHLRQLFNKARSYLKQMGEGAGIEIEPEIQTNLADASQAIPGVLCAGVPGAGGIDAIYAIVLSKEARNKVENMWSVWGTDNKMSEQTMVCPLILNAEGIENGGVRIEI